MNGLVELPTELKPFGPEDQPDVCQHAREPDVCNTRGRGTCATETYFQLVLR